MPRFNHPTLVLLATLGSLHILHSQAPVPITATTIEAIRNYPYFFRGRPVTLAGTIVRDSDRSIINSDTGTLDLISHDSIPEGRREVRGYVSRNLSMDVTSVAIPPLVTNADEPPLRAIVLEPAAYVGRTVTIVAQFRARNLFADLPENPVGRRDDFVVRAEDAAVWITGGMPRTDFTLDTSHRRDAGRWVRVRGVVRYLRGLVWIEASSIEVAAPPEQPGVAITLPQPLPAALEVFFSAPIEGEVDVRPDAPIRIQFSRDVDAASLVDRIRITYAPGDAREPEDAEPAALGFSVRYDGPTRAIEIVPNQGLERFREVRVELLEGITSAEGGSLKPWTLTFHTSAR